MELPPLSAEDLQQSDEELGWWLISTWIGHHAIKAGFALDAIPQEFSRRIVRESAMMDSDSVRNSSIENMFRKACAGDMATAGRMLRTYRRHGDLAVEIAKSAARDEKRQSGTKKPRRPDVDEWIDKKLKSDPEARSPALWDAAPTWIIEQLGKERFAKRVTAARKRKRVASK